MSVDYIVAGLPTLSFGQAPAIGWDGFVARCGGSYELPARWTDLETQLRNAMAAARGSAGAARPAEGCSLYWRNRVLACFQERDVMRRDELLDRVWWDAAGELTGVADPLGRGALDTYAVRLRVALRRARISADAGNAAFDRLTAASKIVF